jgi:glycosyltransferase involved in cell wall biosynthesis
MLLQRFKKHCSKLVLTAHNVLPHDSAEKNALGMGFSLGRIYRSCDRVITHSSYSRNMLVRSFDIDGKNVEVIPHGNYTIFSMGNGNGNGNGDRGNGFTEKYLNHNEILFFGHLREYKGVDVLLRAFARVKRDRDDVFLVIAGKEQGDITGQYRKIMEDENLSDSVILKPGYVKASEMSGMFSNARLVVFPYRETDGSGAVQLAYSFGKPVIASSVGILPEIVEEGVNGYLVPPEDPDALADAIEKFLLLPRYETDKMGRMSKLLAEKLYGWDKIAARTIDLYRSVLETQRGEVHAV